MKFLNIKTLTTSVYLLILLLMFSACKKEEDDGFPITNDLRILQIKDGDEILSSNATDIWVLPELNFVFSHGLNASVFEEALTIVPAVNYELAYDETSSLVTITFSNPLAYKTMYSVSLQKGAYGSNGEESKEDFLFEFTTAAFVPPSIILSSDVATFYEEEIATVTATINQPILDDINLDLVFGGTAEGSGVDYSVSSANVTIPAGQTTASVEITAISDGIPEGEELISVSINNLVNAVENPKQQLDLTLGDLPPSLILKGIMSLKIGGTTTNGRALHLRVLKDIADLSIYGIGIANNGGGSDGREIDFPAISVSAGDDILLVRDVDVTGLSTYFGDSYSDFDQVIGSADINFNGNDPVELYEGTFVIETYGDVDYDGASPIEWDWTGTWAYKLNDKWEYGTVDCSAGSVTNETSPCPYPFCVPLQLQGVAALSWDGSGTHGGKFIHVRANRDIADLSIYGFGTANNGGGTDGVEYNFPVMSVNEGDHILVGREPTAFATYLGGCYDGFDYVFQADAVNQNGDDAIELFNGATVIETFGEATYDYDADNLPGWAYTGSWVFKIGSEWTFGGLACAAGSTSTQSSACPYPFCE